MQKRYIRKWKENMSHIQSINISSNWNEQWIYKRRKKDEIKLWVKNFSISNINELIFVYLVLLLSFSDVTYTVLIENYKINLRVYRYRYKEKKNWFTSSVLIIYINSLFAWNNDNDNNPHTYMYI